MEGINIIGTQGTTGIGKAFDMHREVLTSLVPSVSYDLSQSGPLPYDRTYFQSLPRMVETAVKNFGLKPGDNIGYFEWESSELNQAFFDYARYFSEVWTSSTYAKRALEALGKPVKVVPHFVRTLRYRPRKDKSVVLMTFDGGSKLLRKNPVAGIRAFRSAFGKNKNVKLVVKGRHVGASIWAWLQQEAGDANVEFTTGDVSEEKLEKLYEEASVLLSPHRSEGFGLPLLEAMGYGKVCVASNWGGCTDFLNDANSFLVECKEVPVNDDYYRGTWGEPDHDSMVDALKRAITTSENYSRAAFATAVEWNFTKCVKDTIKALG